MWHSAFLTVFTLFLCCSWLWTVGKPTIQNRDSITTNVHVNLIQKAVMPLGNDSGDESRRHAESLHGIKRVETKERKVPKYMMDLYRKYNADNFSGKKSTPVDLVRSVPPITTASMSPRDQNYHDTSRRHLLIFEVPVSKKGEVLETAELKVSSYNLLDELSIVSLDSSSTHLFADPKILSGHIDAWTTFNVTRLLLDHNADSRRTPLKFIVHSSESNPENNGDLQSMLILSYSTPHAPDRGPSRRKRSVEAEDYEEESNNVWDDDMLTAPRTTTSNPVARRARRLRNTCRRRPLYVDFSEIHYDSWIVAPNGYEAFQCLGKCFFPVSEHLSPTKHAIVQTLIHSVSPGKVSRACCVPTRLEPISVLYVDQRGVLTYRFSYQDMVVAECGCR